MKGNLAHKLCSAKTVKVHRKEEIVGLVIEKIGVLA